jgi:Protein of unknown function (DUF2817)
MTTDFAKNYRQDRRDFIAACEKAGADAISRVHPAMGPDGKPLFCDSAAFGPRDGTRALLLIDGSDSARSAGIVTQALQPGISLTKGARLVVIHALDAFAHAWGRPGAPVDWPQKTLAAIATEDLSHVRELTVLDMEGSGHEPALAAALPRAVIDFRRVTAKEAQTLIPAAIAAL